LNDQPKESAGQRVNTHNDAAVGEEARIDRAIDVVAYLGDQADR
jgi:hypothetical protein